MSTAKLLTKDMTVEEIMESCTDAGDILADWGLGCSMCHIGAIETLEEGATAHGFSQEEVDDLMEEINEVYLGSKKSESERM